MTLTTGEYAIERRARDYLDRRYGGRHSQNGPLRFNNGNFEVDFYYSDPLVGGTDITVVMKGLTVVSDNHAWAEQQNLRQQRNSDAALRLKAKYTAEIEKFIYNKDDLTFQLDIGGIENARDNMSDEELDKISQNGIDAYLYCHIYVKDPDNIEKDTEAAYNAVKYLRDKNIYAPLKINSPNFQLNELDFDSGESDEEIYKKIKELISQIYDLESNKKP